MATDICPVCVGSPLKRIKYYAVHTSTPPASVPPPNGRAQSGRKPTGYSLLLRVGCGALFPILFEKISDAFSPMGTRLLSFQDKWLIIRGLVASGLLPHGASFYPEKKFGESPLSGEYRAKNAQRANFGLKSICRETLAFDGGLSGVAHQDYSTPRLLRLQICQYLDYIYAKNGNGSPFLQREADSVSAMAEGFRRKTSFAKERLGHIVGWQGGFALLRIKHYPNE